jgi:hypothetical protein
MSAFINDISIQITNGTLAPTGRSFDPIIASIAVSGSGIAIGQAAKLANVTAMGYATTDPEYLMAAAMFSQSPAPEIVNIYRANSSFASGGYASMLADLISKNSSWYHLLITSRAAADLNAAGTFANANGVFFIGCSSDVASYSGRNVNREAYLIHDAPTAYPDAAWVGRCAPATPGAINWKWKVLNGQNAASYTTTQFNAIRTANCAALQSQDGETFTNNSTGTSGVKIQLTQGMDYIKNQLEVDILGVMLNTDSVGMDSVGIALIEGTVRNTLHRMAQLGLVASVDPTSNSDMAFSDDKVYLYQVRATAYGDLSAADQTAGNQRIDFKYYQLVGTDKVYVTGEII